MKLITTACIQVVALLVFSSSLYAQASFQNFLQAGKGDANTLMLHYMTPLFKGLGSGFNNGWYNTAKPHKPFGFDLTIAFNSAIVPNSDKSFTFDPSEYSNIVLQNGSNTLPTILGGSAGSSLEVLATNPFTGTSSSVTTFSAPSGISSSLPIGGQVPSPVFQLGIGLIKQTDLKIRYAPKVNTSDISFDYFGIGAMHSISQWFLAFKDLPVDISGLVGYTKVSINYAIPPSSLGVDQVSSFRINSFTFQVVASAHVAVLTGYIGAGINKYNTSLDLLGDFTLAANTSLVLTDPISLSVDNTGFMATAGIRLKLAIFSFNADYSIEQYNTFSVGFGITVR